MNISETSGRKAEAAAANYARSQGYIILAQNWRTAHAEIDIVARKGSTIRCIEVKYRRTAQYGTGLDYITTAKLRQMHKAALMWKQENNWYGAIELGACEVSGSDFSITAFIAVE